MSSLSSEIRRLTSKAESLLDAHQTGRDLEEFEVYTYDPVAFIQEVLREEPWSRQVEIAEAVRDRPQVAVRSAHGCGRDWLGARLALWWCYARRGTAIISGPTATQVEEIIMRKELRGAFVRAGDLPGDLHVRALRPTGAGKAGILAKTASETGGLTGLHDAEVLFCISEAQHEGLSLAFDAAFANAVGDGDRILAYGNPLAPTGRFFQAHRPSSDWRKIHIPASRVPNVQEGRTVVPGWMTREGVERVRREYGEDSSFYRSRVLAEFPEEAEEGVFRRSWLEEAAERWEETGGEGTGTPICALDPARLGPDASVLAIRRGAVLEELLLWDRERIPCGLWTAFWTPCRPES